VVNLHGDAHLEQYAVTDSGRGLTDFDRATEGMAFLDHVRFGVSIHLACRANGWEEAATGTVREFFRGYYAALENPEMSHPAPDLVRRIRGTFKNEGTSILEFAESCMSPMERSVGSIAAAMQVYVDQMREQYPEFPPSFFAIKKAGRLRLGIGSALDQKYLLRIEGSSAVPEDDLILEAKQIRELNEIDCIRVSGSSPDRIMKGQSRLSYQPQRYAGSFLMQAITGGTGTTAFWVFAWDDHYYELDINESFHSLEDLLGIVYDVGVQLGLGHPKKMGNPRDASLRKTLLHATKQYEADLEEMIRELTFETVLAWQAFYEQSALGRSATENGPDG
jgi:hypothetical protein